MIVSKRKSAANRRNALKSTGPRTETGKRKSGQNARRHGLNSPVPSSTIEAFYRVILADPFATFDILPSPERHRRAWCLAEAEARLQRARAAEEAYFHNPDPDGAFARSRAELIEDTDLLAGLMEEHGSDPKGERLLDRTFLELQRDSVRTERLQARKSRLLRRYRAEAEAQRSRALRDWIEAV